MRALMVMCRRYPLKVISTNVSPLLLRIQRGLGHERSPLRSELHQLLGRAYAKLGQEERARGTWEYAALQTRDVDRQVRLELQIAESFRRLHR